jgi:hypothetical protein
MRLRHSFATRLDPERAFAYLSDFGSIEEWDPFIQRADRLDPGPPRVGSRYRASARFLGRELALDYRIVELEPPARVKLVGSAGRRFDGWDEISVAPAAVGPGSTIAYAAEVNLHGVARLLWLAAPLAILSGGRAMNGMRDRLDAIASRS